MGYANKTLPNGESEDDWNNISLHGTLKTKDIKILVINYHIFVNIKILFRVNKGRINRISLY